MAVRVQSPVIQDISHNELDLPAEEQVDEVVQPEQINEVEQLPNEIRES